MRSTLSTRSIRLSAVLSAVSSAVGIAKVEALAKEEGVFAKADQPVTMSIADRNVCATFPVDKSENKAIRLVGAIAETIRRMPKAKR